MTKKPNDLPRYYLYLNDSGELTAQLSDEAMQVCIIRTLTALKQLVKTKEDDAYRKGYADGRMDEAEDGITI